MCSYFKSLKFVRTTILEPLRSHFAKIAHKVAKPKYFPLSKMIPTHRQIPDGSPRATSTLYFIKWCIIIFIDVVKATVRYQAFREFKLL